MNSARPALLFGTSVFALADGRVVVGRADLESAQRPDIDLSPFDPDRIVSRRHAELESRDGSVTLRDLGSGNGTFVDGHPLASGALHSLEDGQRIRFGHLTLVFARDLSGSLEAEWDDGPDTQVIESAVVERLGALSAASPGEPGQPFRVVVERVQRALAEDRLAMVFQPVLGLRLGRMAGVEALSRIATEPRRGPDVWFAEAFDVGLGVELELAAMASALEQLDQLPHKMYLALNASPETVLAPQFAEALDGVPVDRVVVEVTEHAVVSDYAALLGALAPWREAGLRLAIDDMGSGYANMQHVLRLAPDIVKLDVSLVRNIDDDDARRSLAGSLVAFAEEIGARLVAEGIETFEELATLMELGVPYGQGFHLARPAPLAAVLPS